MFIIKEINDRELWNNFIINSNFEFYSFLQSWEWWEFQKLVWKKISRFWIYSDWKLIWVLQLINVNAKRWSYFFVPHWPLIKTSPLTPLLRWEGGKIKPNFYFFVLEKILPELKILAKKEWCSFIRINSTVVNTIENKNNFKKLWFINAPMHEHAEDTHLLNLNLSEDELLQNIKKKDRYYINRALKEWVTVRIDNKKDHIEKLISMHQKHAYRTNWKITYSAFSRDFILNLYKVFWDNISTISASYNWKIESILMTIKFWKICVYYIAASDIKNPKFSPNYLCQWEAIKKAKQDWALIYNFWWVSPDDNPNHPIAWVTIFKRKFSWYDYSLLHTQDLILSPKYYINWIIETIRRIKRGYYYKKPE